MHVYVVLISKVRVYCATIFTLIGRHTVRELNWISILLVMASCLHYFELFASLVDTFLQRWLDLVRVHLLADIILFDVFEKITLILFAAFHPVLFKAHEIKPLKVILFLLAKLLMAWHWRRSVLHWAQWRRPHIRLAVLFGSRSSDRRFAFFSFGLAIIVDDNLFLTLLNFKVF